MKKSLLFLLALSIGLFAVAQERNLSSIKLIDQINDLPDQAFPEPESTIGYNEISPSGIKATTEFNLMKTDIATSANVYSLLLSRQTTLVYCQQLGMLVFAHRAGGPSGNTGDELRINWTFNAGESWEHLIVTDPSGLAMRYPSVAIYNPEGNTDPNNAFFLFSTPMTDAAGWADVAIGSIRLDGEHLNIDYVGENPETTGSFYREGIQVFPDGSAYVAARVGAQDVANPYRGRIMTGQFNADDNLFEWNEPFDIDIQHIAEEYWTGADKFTFSPDGSVGYYVAHGIEDDADVNPYRVRHPIVFKSTDKGNTWEKVEYEPLHNVYFEELWPTLANEDLYIPQFWAGYIGQQYDYGYTVDAYGNLHMLASAVGVYSVHPDSTGFSFTFEPEKLYHMMLNNDGVWTAQYLDSLKTAVVEGSPYGADWEHRIQLARSADGTKVFASWMDTDFEGQEQNLFPDVFVYGRDVNTNLYTDVINATYFTNYWLENFWMYLTDMVLSGDGQYHVPVTTSVPGDTDLDPLMNQLMTGMIFEEADFTIVSIDTPAEMNTSKFEVSQAYPNPAKDYAFIDVTIENNANISVSISNLIGQTVWQSGVNEVAAGKHQLQLNTSDLNAGIYIYNVKVNDNVVSKKLIVN
jgi:hypothetical protein